MTGALDGGVIVVTGAGAGIGLGIARACSCEGALVIGATLRPEEEAVVEAAGATLVTADVADPISLDALWAWVRARRGRIDGLVSNAGLTIDGPFLEMPIEDLEALWRVNQRGTFLACQGAANLMVEQGRGGAIVNIASNHARGSLAGFETYAGTKSAIVAMTRAMAWSLGPHGVRVNALSPGLTATAAVRDWIAVSPGLEASLAAAHATGRVNDVEEVGRIAAFLLSDAASAIAGADIVADQGLSARLGRFRGDRSGPGGRDGAAASLVASGGIQRPASRSRGWRRAVARGRWRHRPDAWGNLTGLLQESLARCDLRTEWRRMAGLTEPVDSTFPVMSETWSVPIDTTNRS